MGAFACVVFCATAWRKPLWLGLCFEIGLDRKLVGFGLGLAVFVTAGRELVGFVVCVVFALEVGAVFGRKPAGLVVLLRVYETRAELRLRLELVVFVTISFLRSKIKMYS